MVIFHTIRLTERDDNKTYVYDMESKEEFLHPETILDTIDTYNKRGYSLAGISKDIFYMSKRVD